VAEFQTWQSWISALLGMILSSDIAEFQLRIFLISAEI
jgi:hypothetical protein